ncbi:MAG: relaxase/mobilization nuclease domain-containing protein [Ginsengibacter sp.]
MISKIVSANSFYHTCRYIAEKAGAEIILTEGVRGHNYKLMAEDFEMQKEMRSSKSQSCFHAILSFYPGENPSNEIMKEIAQKYLKELGIVNTQYAISKHTDRAHLHMHIIANMVNNNGKAISDSWIGLRGKKIAQRLTHDYKLIPALEKNLKLTNLEALSQSEAIKYQIYIAISDILPKCKTMEELESRLLKLGIETQYKYNGQTNEKQGVSFKKDKFCFKGSQVDRKFSLAGLEKLLGLLEKQKVSVQQKFSEQQKRDRQKNFPFQKTISQKISLPDILDVTIKETGFDLSKGLEKTLDILLKAELTYQQTPFKSLQEMPQKKKKKARGLSH